MFKLKKGMTAVALVPLLSACALLPGQNMDVDHGSLHQQAYQAKLVAVNDATILQMKAEMQNYQYSIGLSDQLSINVWSHPEFDSPAGVPINASLMSSGVSVATVPPVGQIASYQVDSQGNIYFPLVGNFHVAGKPTNLVQSQLSAMLTKYVKNPQVTVQVANYNSQQVIVMGEVMKPGLLPLTNVPMTLGIALNTVGGMNVDSANTTEIYVIRGTMPTPTVYWLDGESPVSMLLAQVFPLQNHDVVFVSTAGLAHWNRVVNQILPTVQTIWQTNSMINQYK